MAATNAAANASPVARLIPVLIFFAGLIVLYYLYQYLFGVRTNTAYPLLTAVQPANVDATAGAITVTADKLPTIYEGGEFTFSTWIYINNWSYRQGYNKSILRLGGSSMDTLRIYLGGTKPRLHVRLHTKQAGATPGSATGTIGSTTGTAGASGTAGAAGAADSLDVPATLAMTYTTPQMDSSLTDSASGCDAAEIELQRWVNVVVAVNGKTVDLYLDGGLKRSCVLPYPFKVNTGGYSAKLLEYGGFGGKIASTTMYDSALHPEAVYKQYVNGPEPISSFTDWMKSFFTFGLNVSVSTTPATVGSASAS